MKHLLILLILFTSVSCFSQQENISDSIIKAPQIIYLGIDFSHTQIQKESDKHIKQLQDSVFQEMNLKYLSHLGSLQRTFSKEIITEDALIHSLNSKYSGPIDFDNENIQRIIAGYTLNHKEGIGLVFLVSSLNKHFMEVELYPVFFDIASRKLLWTKNELGSHGGSPGLMHYWYSNIDDAINRFNKFYRLQKAIQNNKFKPNNVYCKLLVDEIDLGYERKVTRDLNISVEAGYRFNYLNYWSYQNAPLYLDYLSRFSYFNGVVMRIDLKVKASQRSSIGFILGYQHLYCPQVTWAYLDNNSGTYDNISKTWKENNNEMVFQLLHHIKLGNPPYPVEFFYGLGLKACMISEHITEENYESYTKNPTNEVIHVTTIQPLLTFGLIIKLVSF